jgi:L-threonylcarbamoyladenylate synthase
MKRQEGGWVNTKEVDCHNHEGLAEVGAEVWKKGKIVVFPTDTVYGLGTNPNLEDAVEVCFRLKRRDEGKSFPVLFSDISEVGKYVVLGPMAQKLIKVFWPGELTLVLPLRKGIKLSKRISQEGMMAVRIPNNLCCIYLINAAGGSLVGTSANISGDPPYADSQDPGLRNFAAKCDYFVVGECSRRIPSTILSINAEGKARMLREGGITARQIASQFGKTSIADFS